MAVVIMSKVELDSPLRYSMELFLNGKKEEYSLDFQTACTKWNRYGGMDGYTYSFNGRTYRDVDFLWQELESSLQRTCPSEWINTVKRF